MGNAEATGHAARESVEIKRERSDTVEQPRADCGLPRNPASRNVVNTPHETLFHEALARARLSFETQAHPSGDRWEADIVLHQKPIVIEVTNSPGQTRNADRYARKTAAFEAAGYRVYWFSNHQARTAADSCVRRVMAENDLAAEESPTALVRANRIGHVGKLNPNWGGGPTTKACEQCGTPVTSGKRNGGKDARFCSSRCYGDWMSEHPATVNGVEHRKVERDWSDLGRLYGAGMSSIQLAEHYGCSKRFILIKMRELGVQVRQQGGPRVRGGLYPPGSSPERQIMS